jgi:hypothetical protein
MSENILVYIPNPNGNGYILNPEFAATKATVGVEAPVKITKAKKAKK